jgi:hypothetical protein
MSGVKYLMAARVERILETSAVTVTVKTGGLEGLPEHMILSIGNQLLPYMALELDGEGFEADLRLFGRPLRRVRVNWPSVVKAEPLLPPPTPGSPAAVRRAA